MLTSIIGIENFYLVLFQNILVIIKGRKLNPLKPTSLFKIKCIFFNWNKNVQKQKHYCNIIRLRKLKTIFMSSI